MKGLETPNSISKIMYAYRILETFISQLLHLQDKDDLDVSCFMGGYFLRK